MRKKFTVNYNDEFFPQVIPVDADEDGQTFSQAKKELVTHLKYKVEHWKNRLKEARLLKKPIDEP